MGKVKLSLRKDTSRKGRTRGVFSIKNEKEEEEDRETHRQTGPSHG